MLLPAMIQASPPTVSLNGQLGFVVLLALVLAFPISFGLIRLYRRAVAKSMRARSSPLMTEPIPLVTSTSPNQPAPSSPELTFVQAASHIPAGSGAALYAEVLHAPWRTAAVYVVAGGCYAIVVTIASLLVDNQEFLPLRFLFLFWIYFWPIVLAVNLVAAATRRAKLASVVVYFLIFAVLSAAGLAKNPNLTWIQIILAWVVFNLPPTLLLQTFLHRRVRAVGPLVLIFLISAVSGSVLSLSILRGSYEIFRVLIKAGRSIGLNYRGVFIGLVLLGFVIGSALGWLVLRLIKRWYERKKISDQSITLDAIWLLFALDTSLLIGSGGGIWILSGLVAFLVFKIVAWAGLRVVRSKTMQTEETARLLLLRVFSLGTRSERLFGALATHWRHVGSIELIAGPDLATDTLEPHEFLDFLSGKLARRFIDGPQALDQRSSEMDNKPDQDGRFRVNDFFCHDDTWKMVLSRLVKESDAVVMDLRGFTSQNKGCVFEVGELINVEPLEKVIFIVDDTTDERLLMENMRQSWDLMKPTSPNRRSQSGQLQLFRFTGSRSGELRQLLLALCLAANTPRVTAS
jgi:hypothetical protein